LRILIVFFLYLGWTSSFNTITGYTGYAHFGHVAFVGAGAYVTAILTRMGLPWGVSLILSGCMPAVLAFCFGPTLLLHGSYFAIATWILAEILHQTVILLDITGGSYGISIPLLSLTSCYLLSFFFALMAVLINYFIEKSRFGFALRAIKSSEVAAETSGINTFKYKLLCYMIAGFIAGVGGGIYALWVGYVCPGDAFNMARSTIFMGMLFLGGCEDYLGPLIGTPLLLIPSELFWMYIPESIYMVLLGVTLIGTIRAFPGGLLPVVRTRLKVLLEKL